MDFLFGQLVFSPFGFDEDAINLAKALTFFNFAAVFSLTIFGIFQTSGAFFGKSAKLSYVTRVFFALRPFLGKRMSGKPWGVVYDSVTKSPIDPAVVTISVHESGLGEYKQTRVTDIEGRFSFLVTPGRYVLSAQKTNYSFPSKIVTGATDGKFENVYHGEVIEVENPYIINLNIPMDPVKFDWNQSTKPKENNVLLEFIGQNGRSTLIIFGLFSSVFSFALAPFVSNLVILFGYLLNTLFLKTYLQKEHWGIVYEQISGNPVARVNVKAIKMPHNISIAHAETDHLGRYFLLVSKGMYSVVVEGKDQDGKPKILAKKDNVEIKNKTGVINFDIAV